MESKKKTTKKLIAVILTIVMVLSMIPVGLFTTVFAYTGECLAVNVENVKVYFYGADSLEVSSNTVTYTGGDATVKSVFVGGNSEIDTSDVETSGRTITFKNNWLSNQTDWIAVQCSSSASVPSSEPSVDIDTTAPTIADDAITGNATEWTKDAITLTVTADDGSDGTGVVAYSKDKTTWQTKNTFEISENGKYTFYAKDAVGNISAGTEITVDKIDAVEPTIKSVAIDPDTWSNKTVTMTVTAEDTDSGLADLAYSIDDGEWQASNQFDIDDSNDHTFKVKDAVGNIAQTTAKADKHDKVKPTIDKANLKFSITGVTWIDLDYTKDHTSTAAKYKIVIEATDDKSGVAMYAISNESLDTDEKKADLNWKTSNEFSVASGSTNYFYVKDNAGNISEAKEVSLKADDVAPEVKKAEPSTTKDTSSPITYTVTASDNLSGIKSYAISDTYGEKSAKDLTWQSKNTFEISDCKKHYIYALDGTGVNVSAPFEIEADNFNDSEPVIDDINPDITAWTNKNVTVTVTGHSKNTAGKSFDIVQYKIDNGEWNTGNTFTITDSKEHKFYVKDSSEKTSKAKLFTAKNYDAKSPELNDKDAEGNTVKPITFEQKNNGLISEFLNKLTFGRFFNERLVITVNAKDVADDVSNASGIVNAKFIFNNSKENPYEFEGSSPIGNKDDTTIEFEVKNGDLPKNFKGTAKVVLTDAASNEAEIMVTTANSNMGDIDGDSQYNFMLENTAPYILDFNPSETPVTDTYKDDYTVEFNYLDKDGINEKGESVEGLNNSGVAYVQIDVNSTMVYFKNYQSNTSAKPNDTVDITTDYKNKKVNDVEIENWNKGELKYTITVVDNSGNVSTKSHIYKFDQTAPQITNFEFTAGYKKGESQETPSGEAVTPDDVSVEKYGFYFKNNVTVKVTAEDKQSESEATATGVKSITVLLKDKDSTLYTVTENGKDIIQINSESEAVAVDTDDNTLTFNVPKDFKGQIYTFATDKVGNKPSDCENCLDSEKDYVTLGAEKYVHPDGSVVESSSKHSETSNIEIVAPKTSYTQNNASKYSYAGDEDAIKDSAMDYVASVGKEQVPLYGNDVTFGVTVEDTYSGISAVSYTIIEGKKQRGAITAIANDGTFEAESNGWTIPNDGRDENLVTKMTKNISVSGNYNDMVLLIELTDNAGNKSYDYYVFGIDKTAPSITVTYDNNDGDSKSGTGTYFKKNRTATVVVTERNFNTEDVEFTIENAEGEAPVVVDEGCTKKDKTGNGDATQYTYKITYKNDGVYTFNVAYTDRANKKASVDTKDSVAPKAFVVDKTAPTINVSYSNNSAQNGKYFKADRTATITVKEHNFDVKRVIITQSSSLSNKAIANPAVTWKNSGDVHTATIHYNANGDYKFDITMTDKAGNKERNVNYGTSVAPKEFTVDKTCENIVTVTGIKDGEVLGKAEGKADSDDVKITIKIDDINIDDFNINLTRNRVLVDGVSNSKDAEPGNNTDASKIEKDEDVKTQFVKPYSGSENTTATISIPKKDKDGIKNDGLYTLKIEAKDKAGNAYDTNANIIVFSVNRYGSVYTFSDDLCSMITDNEGYTNADVKNLSNDITIYEYNPTDVNSQTVEIIRNNDTVNLVKNKDYAINTSKKKSKASWSRNAYTIFTDNFNQDGVYNIRVSSEDEAEIKSQTVDYDVCTAEFKIDRTKPEIVSVNYSPDIEKVTMKNEQATVENDKLTVNFAVEDLMRLDSVEIYVNDSNKPQSYLYGDDFKDANFFDGCSFNLDMSSDVQNFRIVVKDKAGNITDTSDKKNFKPGYVFFDHITVTTNKLVIWSKSPLFWIIIAVVAVLAVAAIALIVIKRRKKDDGEAAEGAE